MEVRELRIGNWLKRLDDTFFQVSASDILNLSSWKQEYLKPKPIELTEEILLKAGFEKFSNILEYDYKHPNGFSLCYDKEEDGYFMYEYSVAGVIFKYVHEIQNLFHSLHLTELKITL